MIGFICIFLHANQISIGVMIEFNQLLNLIISILNLTIFKLKILLEFFNFASKNFHIIYVLIGGALFVSKSFLVMVSDVHLCFIFQFVLFVFQISEFSLNHLNLEIYFIYPILELEFFFLMF